MFRSIEPISKMCWSRDSIMSEDIIRVWNPERRRNRVNIEKRWRFFRQNCQIVLDYIILFDTIFEEKCQSSNQRSELITIITRLGFFRDIQSQEKIPNPGDFALILGILWAFLALGPTLWDIRIFSGYFRDFPHGISGNFRASPK